jgi:hypothetical protein
MAFNWLKKLSRKSSRQPKPRAGRNRTRLQLETLEERVTPDVTNLRTLIVYQYATYGANALSQAVNDAATLDGDTLVVDTTGGNTYNPLTLTKSLTLEGPNFNINPNTGTRGAEAFIDTTSSPFSTISNKTVAINGFAFTTPNGKGALTVFADNYSVTFKDNLIQDQLPTYRSVYVDSNGGAGYTSATIQDNRILNNDPGRAAIMIGTGNNAVVSGNAISGGFTGVQVLSGLASGTNNALVTNNYIENTTNEGIQIGDFVNNLTVSFNTIKNANTLNVAQRGGIRIFGAYSPPNNPGPGGTLTITNNLITASNNGIFIADGSYPPSLTSLRISENSIDVNAGTQTIDTGNVNDGTVNLSGNWLGTAAVGSLQSRVFGTRDYIIQSYLDGNANSLSGALFSTSGSWGFTPDVTMVNMQVPQRKATSGLTHVDGVVQTGINLAASGMTVVVAADTYSESLTVTNKSLTIKGVSPGVTTVTGSVTASGSAANSLTLADLSFGGGSITGIGSATLTSTSPSTGGTYTIDGSTGTFSRAVDQPTGSVTFSGVNSLTVNAGDGSDVFNVKPSPTTALTINANGPVAPASPGDTLNLDETGVTGATLTGGTPNGTLTSSSHQPVTWTSIETLNVTATTTIPNGSRRRVVHNGSNLEVYDITAGTPGTLVSSTPYASVTTLTISGSGTNLLAVDFGGTGGDPIPAGGITFNAAPSPGDSLELWNGSFTTLTSAYAGATSGTLTPDALGSITYSGVDGLSLGGSTATGPSYGSQTTTEANLAFSLSSAGSSATVSNGSGSLLNLAGAGPATTFTNPTASLAFTRGNAADTLTVSGPTHLTSALAVGQLGSPYATATLTGPVALSGGTGSLSVYAGAINLSGAVGSSGGSARNASFNGPVTLTGNATVTAGGSGVLSFSSSVNLGSHTLTVNTADPTTTGSANGAIGGTGGVTKQGTGNFTLTAANSYGGTTTIGGGSVTLNGQLFGAGGPVTLSGTNVTLNGTGTINGSGRGVVVSGTGATIGAAGAGNGLTIITGAGTGVTVNATGTARVLGNTIQTGAGLNQIAITVNAGTALVQDNNLSAVGLPSTPQANTAYPYYGLKVLNGGKMDAGEVGSGTNFTGLGSSAGGNDLSGYQNYTGSANPSTLTSPVAQAILNNNTNSPNNRPGPQGQPFDLYAQNNNFGVPVTNNNYSAVELLVYHDSDFAGVGFVNYTTPSSSTPTLVTTQFYSVSSAELGPYAYQKSMIRRIAFGFDSFVTVGWGAFGLTMQGPKATYATSWTTGGTIAMAPTQVLFDPATGLFRYEYGFASGQTGVETSGSLTDGQYQLRFNPNNIKGVNGANPTITSGYHNPNSAPTSTPGSGNGNYAASGFGYTLNFHRLFGDLDGLGYIDQTDINAMAAALGTLSNQPGYNRDLDYNNDGSIDSPTDYAQFLLRKNRYTSYTSGGDISFGWDV